MQCFAKFCKQCFASFVNTSFARFRKYFFRSFTFVSPIEGCKVSQTRVSLFLQGFTILSSQEFSNKFFVSLVSQGVCNRQFANEHMNTTAYTSARSGGLISLCYPTALSSGMEVLKLYKQKWKEEGGKKCMGTKSLWEIGRCNCWPKIYRVFKNKPTWFCFLEAKWHWDLEEFWGNLGQIPPCRCWLKQLGWSCCSITGLCLVQRPLKLNEVQYVTCAIAFHYIIITLLVHWLLLRNITFSLIIT